MVAVDTSKTGADDMATLPQPLPDGATTYTVDPRSVVVLRSVPR
jgi:hypothetical protein